MAISKEISERWMLPQWLTPAQAAKTGERSFGQTTRRLSAREEWWLEELKRKFEHENNFYSAADLHFSATMAGRPEFAGAASRVYESGTIGQRITTKLRSRHSPESPTLLTGKVIQTQISALKKQLAEEGHQPLLWAEMARNYVLIGQTEQATRCMRIALQLSGPHRYLYRTACRLFVHVNQEDEATDLVRRHPGLQDDPWLMSCEIAVTTATGKTSKHIGRARKLLESGSIKPEHATELAATIASVEHEAGALKRAKKLYAMGATKPTANTLAQIEWAHQKDPQIRSILAAQPPPFDAGEASAWRARHDRNWKDVVTHCKDWLHLEPYSSRPALLGSYYAELLGSAGFELMESISSAGLIANPKNPNLLNNRAVAHTYSGKLQDGLKDVTSAIEHVEQVGRMEHEQSSVPFLRATLGLIAFRSGHVSLGESLYATSIEQFAEKKDRASLLLAALHWSQENARQGATDVHHTLDLLQKKIKTLPPTQAPELQAMLELVTNEANQKSFDISLQATNPVEAIKLRELDLRLQSSEKKTTSNGASKSDSRQYLDTLLR